MNRGYEIGGNEIVGEKIYRTGKLTKEGRMGLKMKGEQQFYFMFGKLRILSFGGKYPL